ncbi:MAG: pantetheine-phosphate adenylyltransferase [Chloroflexota bacterium]|nr:pantetheine-phosphate adenylyltransferase [Chloroflexota bacterium]
MTTQRIAIYPGSFDPVHWGHIDIARRAATLFDHLIVAVYNRPNKRLLFPAEVRVELAREALSDVPNIEVSPYGGLTTAFAQASGAQVLVRGLRVVSDFELEYQMALTNNQLAPGIETICLMTRKEYAFLTGSIIKEIFRLGGDVSSMVPPYVQQALLRKRAVAAPQDEAIQLVSLRD